MWFISLCNGQLPYSTKFIHTEKLRSSLAPAVFAEECFPWGLQAVLWMITLPNLFQSELVKRINLVYVVWKVLVNTHMCSLTDSRAVTSKYRGHDEQLRATSYAAQLELEEDVSL